MNSRSNVRGLLCGASLLVVVGTASANLIVNGNFEAGNSGFTSGYEYTSAANGLAVGGEGGGAGRYAVGTNPNYYHSAFPTAPDHTPTGPGNMMMVNGSLVAGKNVWTGTLLPGLVSGVTYVFSAWIMNIYHDTDPLHADATVEFRIGGNLLGTFTATGLDTWQQFTATYTPSSSGQIPTAVDLKVNSFANDFALDDISLIAVPDGGLTVALLGLALVGVGGLRRKLIA
jgi:hypothetical protein